MTNRLPKFNDKHKICIICERVYPNSPVFDFDAKYGVFSCCLPLYLVVSCAFVTLQFVACRLFVA